jgi:asparagine synthase (glutamine-hydrolysing)
MCGIAGIVYRDGRVPDEQMLLRMAAAIRHRGPDGQGTFRTKNLGLVHTRLSILDLSENGSQPMFLPDRSLGIVFNGEIYNFIELRKDLEALGARFFSNCDTEVILWAYRYWGPRCFERFNGMWALALWDAGRQELILSRDRFGVKPLYYVNRADVLLFASEAKVFAATGAHRLAPDNKWFHQYFTVGYVDTGDETFFEGVRLFPKASYAIVRGTELQFSQYWQFDPDAFRRRYDYSDPVGQLREIFCDSVKLRLRSDVPVGSCLSGGLDSSAIVGVASRQLPAGCRMHTFSSIYKEPEYSEEVFIRDVVKHVNADAHYLYPGPDDAMDMSLLGVYSMEKPCAGPTLISQLNVMREAHRHVRVLLDGQGSDEYLAGYHPFLVGYLNSLWARMQKQGSLAGRWKFWRALFSVAGVPVTNPYAWQAFGGLQQRYPWSRSLRYLGKLLPGQPAAPYAGLPMPPLIHADYAAQMRGLELPALTFERPYEDELDNILYAQFFYQSIPSILLTEDANSMAFSIEARLPFMDYRMVEFMFGLDMEWKVRGWQTKYLQRQALGKYLPKSVRARKDKKGYPTPYVHWLRGTLRERVHEILFSRSLAERELFNPEAVAWLWETHQAGTMDVSWLLYKVISTELWHRLFIDRSVEAPALNQRLKGAVARAA